MILQLGFALKQLGVQYVDLYLIHHPRLALPDIPTAWKKMEDLKNGGLVKYLYLFRTPHLKHSLTFFFANDRSIGISNFGVNEIEILLASAKIKPAVNQVRYCYYSPYPQKIYTDI